MRPVGNSAADVTAYVRLFAASFPDASKYTVDYLAWQYGANPLGPPVGFDAVAGGEVVAHYVCVPMPMRIGASELRPAMAAMTSLEMLIAP
jgi:hypothetical protein